MQARVSSRSIEGYQALVLENSLLRAVVIPALGGRVWELVDIPRDRQWIWQRAGVKLEKQPIGADYDDVWAGGWEELFPNDAACSFEGRDLPDHGEWWALEWEVARASSGAVAQVRLIATSTIIRASLVKEFTLASNAATLTASYTVRSHESKPFHFLFKQHLPVAITPACRLLLPGGLVEPVDKSFSTMLRSDRSFTWPMESEHADAIDLSVVLPKSSLQKEFVYVSDLPAPWCAVEDTARRASLRMSYAPPAVFPYFWLFLSYGGWRGTYTAVLEPCTNLPKDLRDAVRRGQSACLMPGADFTVDVDVTVGGLIDKAS